jgi:hypothetical protein
MVVEDLLAREGELT